MNVAAATVAIQGPTPTRRMITRSNTHAREMQRQDGRLVGHVGPEPEGVPQDPERDDRYGRPVRVVRSEEVVDGTSVTSAEEGEVVAKEPVVRPEPEKHGRNGERANQSGEGPQCKARASQFTVGFRRGDDVSVFGRGEIHVAVGRRQTTICVASTGIVRASTNPSAANVLATTRCSGP